MAGDAVRRFAGYNITSPVASEDPAMIERILAHLNGKALSTDPVILPEGRAPPQARLFD